MPRLSTVVNRMKWCILGACLTLLACVILFVVMDRLAWNHPGSRLVFIRGGAHDVTRCRRSKTFTSLETLAETKWRLMNIRDIKSATINTAVEDPDVKPIGCGVSFSADIEQVTRMGDCVTSRVSVKSVFSNLSHYQGESHLREIKTHYLDRVLDTGLTVPSSLVVLPFSSLTGKHAKDIKQAVDCDISDKTLFKKGVTVYVASWVPNLGAFPKMTPSLADRIHPDNFFTYVMFLYIANCMKSGHSHFATSDILHYVMIDNDRCLLPEKVSTIEMPLHYRKRLTKINSILFRDGHVCSVPPYLISHMQTANSPSSLTPSIGSQFRKMVAVNVISSLVLQEDPEIYEETDGRVATLVAEYNHRCNARDVSNYDGQVSKSFRESRIVDYDFIDEKQERIAVELEGGLTGVATVVRPSVGTTIPQPALAKLFAYYVDRLTGINRMPTVVYRLLHLDKPELENTHNLTENKTQGMTDDFMWKSHGRQFGNGGATHPKQVSPNLGSKKLNVVLVGKMKDFHGNVSIHHEGNLRDFFRHEASFEHLEKMNYSRQTLLDMADIFLLDFLVHRPDRKHFVKSELRLVSTGEAEAWWTHTNQSVCSAILRCPPVLYSTDWSHRHYRCNQTCGDGVNTYLSNCRFRASTVQRIRNIQQEGATLEDMVQMMIKNEKGLPSILKEEVKKIIEGLGARVKYLMSYVDMCEREYGRDILL
ncbi:uncharacterized protein LOC144884276 [Branchiostoma floridae x Branchiostoma japonicum]